ncbi:unnamed protein product [Adineta ricciae]|uniref:RNA helicase n=1 Tax=Adineta ricciae TaxID=249248 RepID=A0A814TY61_ADIRI|nr:unnamed protein product [Adineta ricciae]
MLKRRYLFRITLCLPIVWFIIALIILHNSISLRNPIVQDDESDLDDSVFIGDDDDDGLKSKLSLQYIFDFYRRLLKLIPDDDDETLLPGFKDETPDLNRPGEMGVAVEIDKTKLTRKELQKYHNGFRTHKFNQYVSDLISKYRTLPDVRDPGCRQIQYEPLTITASVVMCFHNEAWSVLIRSIHSILNRSPAHLLKEIILVDDFSQMKHLQQPLDHYIKKLKTVSIVRLTKREGIVRSRLAGAARVQGDVIVFLDSHIEVTEGWLEPLLHPISQNHTLVITPLIEAIDEITFKYVRGRPNKIGVGGFDWNLQFSWHEVPEREKQRRKNDLELIRSPTMAGGLFAISKNYFDYLGKYDVDMDIWGGENLEISFRIWMCGGTLLTAPCSHVGHVFRKSTPYTWIPGVNVLKKNSVRLAEVWLDDYKKYYYERISYNLEDYGNVTSRKLLREKLQCKSFGWYLKEIYPELYIPNDTLASGDVRNLGTSYCLDGSADHRSLNQSAIAFLCHNQGGNQFFMLTPTGEIRRDDGCLQYSGGETDMDKEDKVLIMRCDEKNRNQNWVYTEDLQLHHPVSDLCMATYTDVNHIKMQKCLYRFLPTEYVTMTGHVGLSTVSDLVKQTSLRNDHQCTAAKDGLNFAETAIKTTRLTFTSQQNKLDHSLRTGALTKADYDKQINQLKHQLELDCAPWQAYVKKLSQLIDQYGSRTESLRNNKRELEQSSSSSSMKKLPISSDVKRSRIMFPSSSSSDSDDPEPHTPAPPPATTQKKSIPNKTTYDSGTNTDPLEFSLRTPFSSTPSNIPFTAQTNQITERVPLQYVNEIAAKSIVQLHDEGQLVRWNDVIWRIISFFRVQDLGNLGIRRADQIACVDNLIRTQNKINMYIDAYTYWSTMGTISELESDLARLFSKKDYCELLMGPIEKQPKIEELFCLRAVCYDSVKKDLKSSDILKYLDQYMTKEGAWKTENELNLSNFLKFTAEQVNVKNIYQLGIRIKSVYLARNCIKAMQANQRKIMEIARTELNQTLAKLAQEEVQKILHTIQGKLIDDENQQRQTYASMDPIDIINDMVEICRDLCQNFVAFRKVSDALQIITKDSMLRNIFQIAICRGNLTLPDSNIRSLRRTDHAVAKKIYFSSSDSEPEATTPSSKAELPKSAKNQPSEHEIIRELKEQMSSLKSLSFTLLSRIEQRLCERFQVTIFQDLGYGSFMNFVQQNEQLLFPAEFQFNFSSIQSNGIKPAVLVPLEEIEQFILHTNDRLINEQCLQQMICYHFHIETFEQLGYGSFHSVLSTIKQQQSIKRTFVHYECTMLDELPLIKQKSNLNIQDLEKQALQDIKRCPLLANIHSDTQWNFHFRPSLGKLKSFLTRHSLPYLEIDHVTFLKLYPNSTLDSFKESLYNYDTVLTSGHLVSILVQYGSLQNAPLSLLANIMHTFFSSTSLDDQLYHFLAHVFLRIPYLLLSSVIQRIFLEPLVKLEGSQIKMRDTFWKILDKQHSDMVSRFTQLGQYLGYTEWSVDKLSTKSVLSISKKEQRAILPTPITSKLPIDVKMERMCSTNDPYEVVERIRREKFGIGLNLCLESQHLTEQLKLLVGRSLERLSKELYNTDMHFVLELIQNADDNRYITKPSLIFVIDSTSINIYNNETGFQEHNIQALCDIGKSTKGKHQQGYIGQKGIGFKSVFTICDRPEIYSNGYQICFDAHNGPIGYILPNWINDENRDNDYLNWSTRICLPLKSETEMQKHKSRSLTESFHDIHPSLLLFLNRLRSITIDNRLTHSKHIYERIDLPGTKIIEIHCEQTIEKWFVIKKQLPIPNEIQTNLETLIESTEIALAFPLHEIRSNEQFKLTKQDVYAYLPLRTFGFTFIIQADFEVPSSRQDILSDSIWNQYLLNEIPSLFLSSLDIFQAERSSLPIDPLHFFLCFLPDEVSIYNNNIFRPVCRTILHSLRSRRFLPVISEPNLHMPHECVLVHDSTIKDLLTPELLYHHLNLYYLKDEFSQHEKQLCELGVQRLTHQELIDVLKQMLAKEITYENKSILSKWFLCLYRCLNELSLHDEQNVLKHIQTLKIFPIKNRQEFIALNQLTQPIFFPLTNLHLSSSIENDLLIIDDGLWMNYDENSIERMQIQTLLERLGIQRLSHRIICEQHIFPIFENEQIWKEKSQDILVSYTIYIFDLWSKQKYFLDMSRLKSIIPLLTNHHFKQPNQTSIHFPVAYGNPYDLPKDFHAYNWTLLSDDYIQHISSSTDRKNLRKFFADLGVSDFLLPMNAWTYEQFDSLIRTQSISLNKRLFLALQETWTTTTGNEEFAQHLKDSIWLPTTQHDYSYNEATDETEIKKVVNLSKPKDAYIKSKQIYQLFGQHVPYVNVEIDPNSTFSTEIGLIHHVTSSDVISMLIQWCQSSIFFTSLSHMQYVYKYIYENAKINEIRELIQQNSIFFVPIDPGRGKFVGLSDVCWYDSTNLFTKYTASQSNHRCILEPYYTEQKSIFVDTFGVPLHPTIDEYINLLVHIATNTTTEETIQDAFLVFKMLGKWFKQSDTPIDKPYLQFKRIFPTTDHRWVSINDNPLISDNDDIAQQFSQVTNIPFIYAPSDHVLTFFNMCDIKSLSSAIIIECTIENQSSGVFVQNLLAPMIRYIQLYMKSRPEFAEAYQWTKSIQLSSVLENLRFGIIDNLQLTYRMKSDPSVCIVQQQKSYFDKSELIFYVHRQWTEHSKSYRDIFHSFAQIFLPSHNRELIRALGNFMCLLYNEDEDNLEMFAKYQHFDLYSDDIEDMPWQISSTPSTQIKSIEPPKIDENKVRTLLENVAQSQEQYHAFKRKKREEAQKMTTDAKHESHQPDIISRFDRIQSGNLPSITDTPFENVEQHSKKFDIKDLTHQVLHNRNSAIGSDQASLEEIGRWGEQWVNEYLRSKYQDKIQSNEIDIIWLNQNFEQGKPYDFILRSLKFDWVIYIEVKSTLSSNRQLIPITFNELQHCCSLTNRNHEFQIYRVYNTGQLKTVKLRIVENLEEKLRKHALELFLFVLFRIMIIATRRLVTTLSLNCTQSVLIRSASYRINPIETPNQITVPHSMVKNIERQRAKKIYKKEQEEDPPGDRSQSPVVACKRSEFNHYPGRGYKHMTEKHVASNAWHHRLSKGDFFTIDHHFKNPSWSQATVSTFEQLECKPELVELLQKANIHNPTATQSRVIPELRTGRHMIVAAETGGGKTLAYLVPLIESLLRCKASNRGVPIENAPFAIILAPTRELVVQIENMLQVFNDLNIRTKSLVGINTDKDPLNFTLGVVDFIIATPGVLLRLLRQDEHFGIERRLIGTNLRHVVVDEADTLLDITFSPAVVEIIRRLEVDVQPINDVEHNAPPAVQLIFVSATIPTATEESLKDLISADQIDKMSTPSVHRIMPHVPQKFYRVGNQQKLG